MTQSKCNSLLVLSPVLANWIRRNEKNCRLRKFEKHLLQIELRVLIMRISQTADAVNGFNAVVTKSAAETKVLAAPTKLIAAAPAKFVQPIYAAPQKYIAAAPVHQVYSSPAQVFHAPQAVKYVQQPTAVAYHAPSHIVSHEPSHIVSHANLVSSYHAAPAYYSQYHAGPTHVVSHSPLAYHAPAAAIIHH